MIIDQLPAALSVDPTDELPIEKGQITYKATVSQLVGVLKPSASFAIPSGSVTKTMEGITENHELIRWNFSTSAENNPPCNLSWSTSNGSFTITRLSGTTSESIQPVFALPSAV